VTFTDRLTAEHTLFSHAAQPVLSPLITIIQIDIVEKA